jgi:rubredoxin
MAMENTALKQAPVRYSVDWVCPKGKVEKTDFEMAEI